MTSTALVMEPQPASSGALECPFPGLRPFTEKEERFYFGRERQRDECIRRLQEHRFLALIGTSGSGKSSLVRAGLIPALDRGLLRGADEHWCHVVFRPGPDPMAALTTALCRLKPDADRVKVEGMLRDSSRGLADAISMLLGDRKSSVLLLVDQFEELFRLGKDEQTPQRWHLDRVAFVRTLLGVRASTDVPVYVVTTMRTDFLEDCTYYPDLPEALNMGQYLVPDLTRQELERTIVEPAAKLGVQMSRPLVRQALSDAAVVRDSLPVLQHALMRTWQVWTRKVARGEAKPDQIDVEHYRSAGTAREALDRHGDEILEELGEASIPVAKLIFGRLTLTNADGKVTRSPVALRKLIRLAEAAAVPDAAEAVRRVLEKYRAEDCRFLMPPPGEPLEGAEIDISHEAVARVWKKLAGSTPGVDGWIAEEHRNRRTYARLFEAMRLWCDGNGQLLDQDSLTYMEAWWKRVGPTLEWASRYHVLDEEAQAIVERAKQALLALEQPSAEQPQGQREEINRVYRAELDAWHGRQFEAVRKYLNESLDAKAAALAAKVEAERLLRRARRTKWWVLAVMGALVILVFFFAQQYRLSEAGKEITRREAQVRLLDAQKTELTSSVTNMKTEVERAENAKLAANRASAAAHAAKGAAEASALKAGQERVQAEAAASDARKKEQDARAALGGVNRELATATEQKRTLTRDLAAKQAVLDDREKVLKGREDELVQQRHRLDDLQRRLDQTGVGVWKK